MFGSYAQVAAYYGDGEVSAGVAPDHGPIPPDYLPPNEISDPWFKTSACHEDLILVAEFSEQEGPKPLITIPNHMGKGQSFDLNEFSVKIMSVDYQTNSSQNFSLCEDKHVVASDCKNNIYFYVHHFTLYDSRARGFVRPFCMTYVTPDRSKLTSFYEEISCEFEKVSHCFKYGNRQLFVHDMTHYLSDLHYTKERFLEREKAVRDDSAVCSDDDEADLSGDDAILATVSLSGLDALITEVQRVLQITSDLPTDQELELRFRSLEEKATSAEGEVNKTASSESLLSFDNFHYSCSLQSHTGSPSLGQEMTKLKRSESFSDLDQSWNLDPSQSYKPRVVRTTKKKFDKSLRSLHELCRWGAKEGLNRLRSLHRYFSRDRAVLQIERKDASAIEPTSGLLTIGRNVQLNFLCGADLYEQTTPLEPGNCSLISSPSVTFTRRWLSDDTLASFHSAESFLSCQDDTPASQDTAAEPVFIMGNSCTEERVSEGSFESSSSGGNHLSDPLNTTDDTGVIDDDGSGSSVSSANGCCSAPRPISDSRHYTVVRPDRLEFKSPPSVAPRVSVVSAADHINNYCPASPGYGMLRLSQQYSFTPALLYALLTGRPVVVQGSSKQEKDVHATVTALSLFVTGHTGQEILPWTTKPLKLTDLARVKLVGLGRTEKKTQDTVVPSSIKLQWFSSTPDTPSAMQKCLLELDVSWREKAAEERYVSILNLENKTLWTPPYQGGVLTDIYTKRKVSKKEQFFIAYIHSVLYELSQKALLYYHAFSTSEMAATNNITDVVTLQERQMYENMAESFCAKLCLSSSDIHIIQYLSDVVQHQQLFDLQQQQHSNTDLPVPSVRLDYRQCSTYRAT